MKKLFRFKYEPCNGTCYSHKPIFFSEMKKTDQSVREQLVNTIIQAHDKLCDNSDYYFGLDLCEESNVFIGHFVQPDRVDTFTGTTLERCVSKMCNAVIDTDIPVLEGACVFGDNGVENLAEQILKACAA